MAVETEVREASQRFYAALNAMVKGENTPMADVWVHDASVSSMHPIGGRETGWDQVHAAFAKVGGIASNGHVELVDQAIQTSGDMAYEVGIERGHAKLAGEDVKIEHRVTNVYRREADGWKIVHHHTDVSRDMVDLVTRLQQKS